MIKLLVGFAFVVAVAQSFILTPWCRTLMDCESELILNFDRCGRLVRELSSDNFDRTDCQGRFWKIANGLITRHSNVTRRYAICINGTDPKDTPDFTDKRTTRCTTMMADYPTSFTMPQVIESLFGRVAEEIRAFMGKFVISAEFNDCVTDAYAIIKHCYPMSECCNVAMRCRETLSMPKATVMLNRMFKTINNFNQNCKQKIDFNEDFVEGTD